MQEVVRVLQLDVVLVKSPNRKVLQVEGDDGIGRRGDGSRQQMSVIRVWELKALKEFFVILNKAIKHGLVHEVSGPLQL